MARNAYPSDLTDEQWNLIVPLIPRPKSGKRGGRPQTTDMRAVVNGVLYLSRAGCSWRMLPRDFPPWPPVQHYYRQWRRDGMWKKLRLMCPGGCNSELPIAPAGTHPLPS